MRSIGKFFLTAGLILMFGPIFGFTIKGFQYASYGFSFICAIIAICIAVPILKYCNKRDAEEAVKQIHEDINNILLEYSAGIKEIDEQTQNQLYDIMLGLHRHCSNDENAVLKKYNEISTREEYYTSLNVIANSVAIAEKAENSNLLIFLILYCIKYYSRLAIHFNDDSGKKLITGYICYLDDLKCKLS